MGMYELYKNTLKTNHLLTYNAIKQNEKHFGLLCNIYFPQKTNIYSDSSQENEYLDEPDISDYFVVTGLNILRPDTNQNGLEINSIDIDSEIYMFTTNEDYFHIPRNSKVEVFFGDNFWTFRTFNKPVLNGIDKSHLYVKYHLIPYV